MNYVLYSYYYCKTYFQRIKMLKIFFLVNAELFSAVNSTEYSVIYEKLTRKLVL